MVHLRLPSSAVSEFLPRLLTPGLRKKSQHPEDEEDKAKAGCCHEGLGLGHSNFDMTPEVRPQEPC